MKYVCNVCGYVYDEAAGDPDNGITPGTKWEDLPADFTCPLCSVGKDEFSLPSREFIPRFRYRFTQLFSQSLVFTGFANTKYCIKTAVFACNSVNSLV